MTSKDYKYSIDYFEDQLDDYIAEGPIAQQAGRFAGSVGRAIGAGAKALGQKAKPIAQKGLDKAKDLTKAAGKELGNKVTIAKLTRAWKLAGEPTDTASIANILKSQGLTDEQIGLVSGENNVELKPQTVAEPDALQSLADEIKKSNSVDLVKQYLQPKAKPRVKAKATTA